MAESELINRFERTHGQHLEMFMPKQAPLQNYNSARNSIGSARNSCSGESAWGDLIERTQDNVLSSTLKRGDYALSNRRESERVNASRTLDPSMQEINPMQKDNRMTGCSKQR